MERWERELQRLKGVDAPVETRARVAAGPTGDGMPPSPSRGQRVAAGVVALVVVVGAGALLASAFGRDDAAPIAPTVDAAVITLTAEPNDAVATLTYGGASVHGLTDSYCWSQENGAMRCADVIPPEPFPPDTFLEMPRGTPFVLENEDGADPVVLSLVLGADPTQVGDDVALDALAELAPGDHVLSVTATWEGRGDNVTFHFPLRILRPASSPEPTLSPEPTPTPTGDPSPAQVDRTIDGILRGSSWSLSSIDEVQLDIERPPTLIFGNPRLVGFTGCNGFGAESWSVADGRLLTDELVMTLIGCQGSTGALEERFLAILGDEPTIAIDGTNLGLSSDGGTMVFDRIDVEHDDIVGSYLDCGWWDQVDITHPGVVLQPGPPTYFTVNLPWTEPTDGFERIAGSAQLDEASRWIVVREGLVIAEVNYPDLTGVACATSGA